MATPSSNASSTTASSTSRPTYYIWTGVGAIVDLDGEGYPEATNREDALRIFFEIASTKDMVLFERVGTVAYLLAARMLAPGFVVTSSDDTRLFRKE